MIQSRPTGAGLAAAILLAAFLVGITTFGGVAIGSFGAFLLCCYLGSLYLSARACFLLAADLAAIAILPWLGLTYPLVYPPTRQPLFQLELRGWGEYLLQPLYHAVAQYPLHEAAMASRTFFRVVASYDGKDGWHVEPFAVFVFWAGLALAFAMSGLTGLLVRHTREEVARTQWLPQPRLRPWLLSAGVGGIVIFLLGLVLWDDGLSPDATIRLFFYAFKILLYADVAGLVFAFHLRAPLPEIVKFALCGAAIGGVLAEIIIPCVDLGTYWKHVEWFGRLMPACVILGAAAGALANWLLNKTHLAPSAVANG